MESRYFFKVLYVVKACVLGNRDLADVEDVINEIKREVHDLGSFLFELLYCLEPLVIGSSRHPSSAFCILYKLARMRITYQELSDLIHCLDNTFVRGIGYLYIRFAIAPRELWKFYAPYFDDNASLVPFSDKTPTFPLFLHFTFRTIGRFVTNLITNKRYQAVMLPAIPVSVKREWEVNLIKLEALSSRETKPCEIHVGDSVMGFYGVDMKWYPAKVLKVLASDLLYIMYDVYNNKEIRTRGHVLVEGEDPVNIK